MDGHLAATGEETGMLAEVWGEGGLIALVIIAVLLFGGAAIPKLARSLGSAKKEFEQGMQDGQAGGPVPAAGQAPPSGAESPSDAGSGSAPRQ